MTFESKPVHGCFEYTYTLGAPEAKKSDIIGLFNNGKFSCHGFRYNVKDGLNKHYSKIPKLIISPWPYDNQGGIFGPKIPPHHILLKDSNISWIYIPDKKIAFPSSFYCGARLTQLAQKYGESVIRKKYNLPKDFPIDRKILRLFHLPAYIVPFYHEGIKLNKRETVCNISCDVWEMKNGIFYTKFWVHPKLQIIMKQIRYTDGIPSHGVPAKPPSISQMTKFIEHKNIDASRFSLPPGTTVFLPKLLFDIPLPSGVKREAMTGNRALCGFDFPLIQKEIDFIRHDMDKVSK